MLISQYSGCKVGWEVYDDEAEARAAAERAKAEADRKAALGYDFGYCIPGEVVRTRDGNWRVTTP